ncbi:hypothetical protein GCM10020370_37990 [Paenibacillus hodogayensis]
MKREIWPQPRRLLNEQYMQLNQSFNIFVQRLPKPSPLHWHEFYEMCVMSKYGCFPRQYQQHGRRDVNGPGSPPP